MSLHLRRKSSARETLSVSALATALLVAVATLAYGAEVVRARIWADALQLSGCRGKLHE